MRRFRYLYTGEATAAIFFIALSVLVHYTYAHLLLYTTWSFWSAFLLLELLLAQGTYYWYYKYTSAKARTRIPSRILRNMRRYQRINWVLMGSTLFVIVIEIGRIPTATSIISAAIYAFALLEYVNYFHVQLSYDNRADWQYLRQHQKLKVASLQRDFQRLKGD